MNFETYLLISMAFSILLIFWIFRSTPEEKEYNRKLKESLADEFIIDPETGVKITLEEAESGHWVAHDNEFRTVSKTEIKKLYSEEEKDATRALNYLRESLQYRKHDLTEADIELLDHSKMLTKYDDWTYSDAFRIEYCKGMVFLPAVYASGNLHSYFQEDYHESQLMFWIKFDIDFGHYYLREKTAAEAFFDSIKGNDDLILSNYESFTFEKSKNVLYVKHILKNFEGVTGLEIEFFQKND